MSDLNVYVIATRARRFGMLADRPALLYPNAEQRTERVLADDTKSAFDVMLLAGSSEADRVCAAAVATLRGDALGTKPILSLLSVLPADYLLGIYFALPVERRGQCESDPVWAYHLRRVPDGVEEASIALDTLAEDEAPELILEGDEAIEFRRLTDGLLRDELSNGV